jgi:(p)ppGpp synthase/HD superfamily hydrolase
VEDFLRLAEKVARSAHEGQSDKGGNPYIDHPQRVAQMVEGDDAKQVAWLHDVIEDTSVTSADLLKMGFSHEVVGAVLLLTKRRGTILSDYYAAIRENALALTVKTADIADNMSPERHSVLPAAESQRLLAKYTHALEALGVSREDLPAIGEQMDWRLR